MKTTFLLRFICFLFVIFSLPQLAKATHIVGGEITYECLGNNQYEITLKVYRDCFNGREPFDNPGYIGIYNLRGDLIENIKVLPGLRDTLEPTLNDPCLVVPGTVCVDTVTYKTTVTLANNPVGGAYQITYVRCCRNETISNIVDPVETGAVYDIYLTREAMLQCNNSPIFNKLPPNFICADKPFVFDHSASDADGDSLVYSLCTPFSGGSISNPRPIPPRNPPPFDNVIWQTGFGLENLFGMGIPLRIDPVTGVLTATPGQQGQFVVGVCVEEYDRETGQLLSTVRRDFQYNVGICGDFVTSEFSAEVDCKPTVKFNNESENATSFRWYFDFPNTNLTSTEVSPTFTFPATGTYTVALIADPGEPCTDTSFQEIVIRENTIDIDFDTEVFNCQDNAILNLQDRSTDANAPIVRREWMVTYGDLITLTSNEQNPSFEVPLGVDGTIRFTVTSEVGCSLTLERPFSTETNPPPLEMIPDTIIVCAGERVALNPNADDSSNLTYRWTPADRLEGANTPNPIFVATETTTFTVRVSPGANCEASKNVLVIVNPRPTVNLGADQIICVTDTIPLTANVTGGTAPYQFNWNRGSGQSQEVAPLATTIYIVTVTDANGCSDVDSVRVTVNPNVALTVGADDRELCQGETTTVRANVNGGVQPYTYAWNQGLPNAPTHEVSPTQTTSYAVTVTDANGCRASEDITVFVNTRPTVEVDTTLCADDLNSYRINITSNANEVVASAGTVVNNGDGTFSIINIPTNQNVQITATLDDCETQINVTAPVCACPDVSAPISGGDRNACAGEAFPALTVTVPNGQTADWYDAPNGGNLLLESSTSFMPTQPGTYYAQARVIATGCTSDSLTAVTLTTSPAPSVTVTAPVTTVCAGDEVQLNAAVSGGTAPYTFSWSQNLNPIQNPIATPFLTTTYAVTVSDANGCRDTAQITINVDPLPRIDSIRTTCSTDLMTYSVRVVTNGNTVTAQVGTVTSLGNGVFVISDIPVSQNLIFVSTFNVTNCGRRVSVNRPDCQCPDIDAPISGGDQMICAGQPIPPLTVTVSENQTADWYSADLDGDTLLLGSTSFTPTQAGTYYAVARDTITQCTSRVRTPVVLTINDALVVNANADATEICEGETANLTATVSGGMQPFTFNWNQGLGEGQNKMVTPTQTTTYIVTVTDAAGCTGIDSVTIMVNSRPNTTIDADQTTICAGDTATLTASAMGGNTPYTFNWNQGLGSGATKMVSPSQTTTYQVITNDGNNCTDTTEITITVNPRPNAQLNANRTSICAGDTTMLMATVSGGTAPYTFSWNPGTLSGENPIVNPTTTTTYIVTITDSNGCSDTAQITITVTESLDVNIAANDETLCPGESADLSVRVNDGVAPFSYNWNQGLPNAAMQTVTPAQTTTYIVTVTDANGCLGVDSILITVNPNPTVEASASDTVVCAGTSTELSATASGGTAPYTFTWNPGNLSGQNQTVSPTDTTTYTVVVTDANGCTDADDITIFVPMPPSVTAGASAMTICAGDSTTLMAMANGGLSPYTFNWDNGLGAGTIKTVAPTQTTTYNVTVTDANGCEATASITITVRPNLNVTIFATQDEICQGDSTTLTVEVENGSVPFTYRWNQGLNGDSIQMVSPAQTTTYEVTVTDANGCKGSAEITIMVNPRPMVMVSTDMDMICEGESVTLTAEATGTGNLTYQWSNGATGSQQTVNPTETTTYMVTVTSGNNCTATDSVTIIVNPRPEAMIQASKTAICLGDSSVLNVNATGGTAPYTFQWNENLGTNDTVVVNPTQTTNYQVIVTDTNGCRDTAQITIMVTPGLDVTIAADSEILCEGEKATLTVTSDGLAPFTYNWDQGLLNNATQIVMPVQTTTYNVTVTDANGCVGMDEITITVQPSPEVEVSADRDTICASDPVVLTAMGSGGTGNLTYQWSNGATGSQQTVNPTQTTTYTVTVTDANGCSDMPDANDSIIVVVNPRPQAMIQASLMTICAGGSSTLVVNATGGTAPYTFQWNENLGTNDTVVVSPTQTTNYQVIVTDVNGCRDTAQITITVREGLNVTIVNENDSDTLCVGQLARLRVSSDGQAPFTYVWNQGLPGDSVQTVMPTQTTTYSVTVTDAAGCEGTQSVTIFVFDPPMLTLTASDTTVCEGDAVSVSATVTGGTGPFTFIWNVSPSQNDTIVLNPTDTVVCGVIVIDANGCRDTANIQINVNPRPVVNAGNDTLSCSGSTIPLMATATSGTPTYVFEWDQNLGSGADKIVTPTQPTTYNVTVTDANGCTDTDAIFVDVFPLPTDLPEDSITVCANVSSLLAPNIIPRPGAVYQWSPTEVLDNPNSPNPTITTDQSTTIFVTITYRGICTIMDTVQVTVPPAINLEVSNDTTVCTSDSIPLFANSAAPGVQIVWSTSRNFNTIIGTGNTISVAPNGSAIYYMQATDDAGCNEMDSIVVNAFPIRATITPDQLLCEATNEVRLAVTNPDAVQVLDYTWSPANAILSNPDSSVVFVNPNVATDYTVELVNQFGCRDTLMTSVEVVNLQIQAVADPDTVFAGESTQLNVTGACENCTYAWLPTDGLSNPNIANPIATPNQTTVYSVVASVGNCTEQASVRVVVNVVVCDKEHIFLPSAFSPNGDGVNDLWQIRSNFLDQLEVRTWVLYNRWGQKIFETTDRNFKWDGTFRGQPLPPDVFGYYARIICPGNQELILQGNLTLIR